MKNMRIFKRHLRRLIAIILATAFAVSAVSLCFPLSASETDGTSPPLSSDSILRDYVDGDELDSAGYKARLIGLEDDNTYVFDNGDGTHTVYMMYEDLKYTDSSGKVREKDLSLVRKSGGYSIASSNIGLYMPDAPKNGINMSYAGRSLTITPLNTGDCDALTLQYLKYCRDNGWNLIDHGDEADAPLGKFAVEVLFHQLHIAGKAGLRFG